MIYSQRPHLKSPGNKELPKSTPATIDKSNTDEVLCLPMNTLIEVKKATIVQGYRLVIHDFDVVDDTL